MNGLKELWKAKVCSASLRLPLSEPPHKAILPFPNPHTGKSSTHQMTSAGAVLPGGGCCHSFQPPLCPPPPHIHPRGGDPNKLTGHLGITPRMQTVCQDKAQRSAHLHSSPPQLLISKISTPLGTCKSFPPTSQSACTEVVSLSLLFFLN